jgi:hypothetical protein
MADEGLGFFIFAGVASCERASNIYSCRFADRARVASWLRGAKLDGNFDY